MSNLQKRNSTIDVARYVASIMVIAIHADLFLDVNSELWFATVQVVCRLAVPFFAVCTGYFLSQKVLRKDQDSGKHAFLRQWKKFLLLYAVWTVLFLLFSIPKWIEAGEISVKVFVDYAIMACTQGAYFHLWYLLGIIYTLPLFFLVIRFFARKYWVIVAIVLWPLEMFVYAYYKIVPESAGMLLNILSKFDLLLRLLPLLLLGAMINQFRRKPKFYYFLGFAICFICLFSEAFALVNKGLTTASYIAFTLPTAYFLFNCLLSIELSKKEKWVSRLPTISLFVYCVHPMVLEVCSRYINHTVIRFLFTTVGSTLLGVIYEKFQNERNGKKVVSCSN